MLRAMKLCPTRFCEIAVLGAAISLGGCADDETTAAADAGTQSCTSTDFDWGRGGGDMLPGTDCNACHRSGGHAESVFSIAGTVFESTTCPTGVEGVIIRTTDATSATVELASNEVGNFYTDEPVEPPYRFSVESGGAMTTMIATTSSGSCGECHVLGSDLSLLARP